MTPKTKIDVGYTDKPVHSEYLLIEQMCAWHYAKRFTYTILFNPDNNPWTIVLICADKTEAYKSEATCSTKLLGGRARVESQTSLAPMDVKNGSHWKWIALFQKN